jgi:probable rRNA maturation factor
LYTIKKLNRIYRKRDEITDVLAFGLQSKGEEFIQPPDNILHLGDVVICYQKAVKQAKHSVKKELAYLLIHGVLHLLGYNHKGRGDRKKMEEREKRIAGGILNNQKTK